MTIDLNDENSHLCAMHPQLKCRIYPKTQAELEKHYRAARLRANACSHFSPMDSEGHCVTCEAAKRRRGGPGKVRDPTAITHKAGMKSTTGKRKHE